MIAKCTECHNDVELKESSYKLHLKRHNYLF